MTERRKHAAALAAVLAVAAAAYVNTLGHGFVWDDHILVEQNAFVRDPGNARKLFSPSFWRSREPVEGAARPVLLLSLLADRAAWGERPGGYHATNVGLHAAAAAAFYGLTAAAGAAPPLAAALLFAVHPANSEAVNLVSFRADVLAALFAFLSLTLYLRARRAEGRSRWPALCGAVALYGLAVLSKEMALTTPALALLWELTLGRRERPAKAVWAAVLLLFAATAAAYLVFRAPRSGYKSLAGPRRTAADPARPALDPSPPPWSAMYADAGANARAMTVVAAGYARLLAWPAELRADRAPALFETWRAGRVLGASALLLALALACAAAAVRGGPWGLALGWFFVALIPVSNAVPLYNPVAERYLYFVTPAAAWAAALLLARVPGRGRAAALAALTAALGARTALRNPDWRSDAAFVEAELRSADPSARVLYNAGLLRQRAGDLERARGFYERALAAHPASYEAAGNLAGALEALGRKKEAAAMFERARSLGWEPAPMQRAEMDERLGRTDAALAGYLESARRSAQAAPAATGRAAALLVNEGVAEHQAGRLARAAELLERARALAPHDAPALHNLAKVRVDQQRLDEARRLLERLVSRAPGHVDARYDLAVVYHRQGRLVDAEAAYRAVVGREERLEALHNLAGLLEGWGRLDEAEPFARRAAALAPSHHAPQTVLGNIMLKRGDPAAALPYYRGALAASQTREEAAFAQANIAACVKALEGAERARN